MTSITAILLHLNAFPFLLLTIGPAMHQPNLVLYAKALHPGWQLFPQALVLSWSWLQ